MMPVILLNIKHLLRLLNQHNVFMADNSMPPIAIEKQRHFRNYCICYPAKCHLAMIPPDQRDPARWFGRIFNARDEEKEPADKPGSVVGNHSSGNAVTSGLKRPTRESVGRRLCAPKVLRYSPIWSCSEWGLPCRGMLPPARCALTAPFHPYHNRDRFWRYIFCGTFRRLAPPRNYLAPCPPEPGLSSRNR
jgi:hypothetical protein